MELAEVFDPYLSFRLRITTTARWQREAQGKRSGYAALARSM
jgi:hypothetical protein